MKRIALVACLLAAVAAPIPAREAAKPPSRHVIEGVAPLQGRDVMVKGITRALRVVYDPDLSEDYLFGLSGLAFSATVCANNCTCRDFREMYTSIDATLDALGVPYEFLEGKDPAIWEKMKASIAAGVPVTAWGLFGDRCDAAMVGYDEEKDLAYGWGMKPDGKEYMSASLSKFTGGWMSSYVLAPAKKTDRAALERTRLEHVVRMAHRASLEGG
ncbi:MAG: hypothetical protein ABFS86_12325 [Planctomycetota bacterium]